MKLIRTDTFELATTFAGNKNSKKLALVLPGRLDTKDYACFSSHLKLLADNGFYAVCFDPPGTWESPGPIELFTTTNYIKAVNELIDLFGNKKTLLLGHSRGGAIATLSGCKNPYVGAIVLINPSLGPPSPPSKNELTTGIHISYRDYPPGNKKSENQKKFEMPLNYFSDGAKYNDAEVLKTCAKPKLLFYGVNDEFNSPEYVKEVFISASDPKELYELACNHDYRYYPETIDDVNYKIREFVNKYL